MLLDAEVLAGLNHLIEKLPRIMADGVRGRRY